MKDLLTVIRMELLLCRRTSMGWPLAIFMVCWGLFLVTMLRSNTYYAWLHFVINYFVMTLILTLLTGNQIQRDRDQRVASVIWSTPIGTSVYACGKYLAALLLVVGFATLQLLASLVLDRFVPGAYPTLGAWPYLWSWVWLVLPALVFGLALTLCSTTLTQRPFVTVMVVVLIWVFPIISGGAIPEVINITGFVNTLDPAQAMAATLNQQQQLSPSAEIAQQIVQLVQIYVPQAHLTPEFLVNRFLFLSLAMLACMGAIKGFSKQRQGTPIRGSKRHSVTFALRTKGQA